MEISKIIIIDYQQFKFLNLDLTYPTHHELAGTPLRKICLIGKNGTGKTTILNLLFNFFKSRVFNEGNFKFAIKFKFEEEYFYAVRFKQGLSNSHATTFLSASIESTDWLEKFKLDNFSINEFRSHLIINLGQKLRSQLNELLIYSPAEVHSNVLLQTSVLPLTNLNNALAYFRNFPYSHDVSFQNVQSFWDIIIYQVKKRESDYQEFLHLEENKQKVIGDVEKEFNIKNPFFLERISDIWNRVLDRSGLYFDIEKAKIPMQLTENLQAYIKLKSNDSNMPYGRLSSGIRHYIFRLGYIASLYFNRSIKSAIALIDEPENSLFPDLLYDLVEQYSSVTENTQFFYATHSPIIASQFEACERIILDFDDTESISYKSGVSAIGDEPNDILIQDFGLETLLGKEGIKKWERYIELKILMKNEEDEGKKEMLAKEFLEIGKAYNF